MKERSTLSLVSYCLVTVLCIALYGVLVINYDNHIMSNIYLFVAIGVCYIGYIPWTILSGVKQYKTTGKSFAIVHAIAYSLFLLLIFFGELSKYINYTKIMDV